MLVPVPVFSETDAKFLRGEKAKIDCPDCHQGVGAMLRVINEMECNGHNACNECFSKIIWEQWRCGACGRVWVEKYGIMARGQGVIQRIQQVIRNETPPQKG